MPDPIPNTYRESTRLQQRNLDALIELGFYKPFFLHHFVIFALLTLVPLLVPRHGRYSQYIRDFFFIAILEVGFDVIKYRRALLAANGYVIGVITSWWIVWSATLFYFNDPERDFRRIERRNVPSPEPQNDAVKSHTNNGFAPASSQQNQEHREVLVWQPYPRRFSHRLNWALGLIFNMRGPEWNWRITSIGPLPKSVFDQLSRSVEGKRQSDYSREPLAAEDDTLPPESRAPLKSAFTSFITCYLALDIIKTSMMRDPYFLGVVQSAPPYPINFLSPFPNAVLFYREILSGLGIICALAFVSSFNCFVFYGLSRAFPSASRKLTSVPLDAPWLYASTFGPFLPSAMDHGLAGCWGHWWHQLFRFGFLSVANAITYSPYILPHKLIRIRSVRNSVRFLVAFGISAIVHACGSYTQPANTKPFSGPLLFFLLQVPGVLIQGFLPRWLLALVGLSSASLPRWVRRSANFAFVVFWLMVSARSIVADFAVGLIWLSEPIPLSLCRGLGFGAAGEGWWCWWEPWFRYYSDGSWLESGVRVL